MPKNNWEIEFDERFYFLWDNNDKPKQRQVKSFIRKRLSSQIEEVEGILTKIPQGHTPDGKNHWIMVEDLYEALTKIKALR